MNELEIKLRDLKFKKAFLFAQIESLAEVEEKMFTQFGKLEAEILKLKKELIRTVENNLSE
jgi:putative cell wall-binding protein